MELFPEEVRRARAADLAPGVRGGSAPGGPLEVEASRANGRRFPAEFSMTRTPAGNRLLFTVHLRDITGRQQEQAKVRESAARFRAIADGIPQLAWMTSPEGSVTWYNQRWYDYTGTTFDKMQGWGWRAVQHPDHLERVERRLRRSFEQGEAWEDTFPLRAADGSYGWFLSRAIPIREEPDDEHPGGKVLGWFGSNTDVTAMREVEHTLLIARDEAEAANLAKSTFMANMSHELRTPLSAIIGYSEMISEEIEDGMPSRDLADDVKKIETNARHLLGLINDVLDLSKVESGRMEAYAEEFDVAEMVRDLAGTVGTLVEKKGNRLKLSLAEGLGTMRSDVTRVRQALLNLVGNAAKFTENGLVTLSVERMSGADRVDRLRFSVQDTGIGMTADQLAKLFQRFQQADASTTRQFGGTGLGLALTKAFVALLGGGVEVTSAPGEGSIFTIELPAILLPTVGGDTAGEKLEMTSELAGRDVVLVVDDDETQRELTARFLVREGYAARTAADGAMGLALARRLHPRAILLDVTMPGMDGWSVLSSLKADPDLAGIPVVMVTFATERTLAATLGAADFVVKPVDWNRLRHVMGRFAEGVGDVLIVDDDADARKRLRGVLAKNGWKVVEASDGLQALDMLKKGLPCVVLLDVDIPVMNGFDFLDSFRATPGCEDVPVVVLTAMDLTTEDRRRLRGANQVLKKGDASLRAVVDELRRLAALKKAT